MGKWIFEKMFCFWFTTTMLEYKSTCYVSYLLSGIRQTNESQQKVFSKFS